MTCGASLNDAAHEPHVCGRAEGTDDFFVLNSVDKDQGGLILVDEKYAALAEGHSELSLECVLHFLASLLDIAVHLIDVAFGLKLTVASRLSDRLSTLPLAT